MRALSRFPLLTVLVLASGAALAQVFGPSGAEFRVNSVTTGSQNSAAVAVDRAFGSFFVTWVGPDGTETGILGRRFAHSGAPIDAADFRVNAATTVTHTAPRVAAGTAGDFVCVWQRDKTSPAAQDVFGQRFDSAGETGGVFGVNTTSFATFPDVGADSSLAFVVVWDNAGVINAQRYDGAGAPAGSEFQVSQGTFFNNDFPSVSRATTGEFVVTYQKGYDVFARRYDANGAPLAAEFQVNELTGDVRARPRVATNGTAFVVAWQHYLSGNSNVKARVYAFTGAPATGEFLVNAYTTGIQAHPDVGMDGNGAFVVAWQDRSGRDGELDGVFARRFGSDGGPLAAGFRVNTTTSSSQHSPSIGMQANGDFVVAWTDYSATSGDVRAQRYCHALAGDANASGDITVSDVFWLINNLFAGGPAPLANADVNGDGSTNVNDVFYLINYLFAGGPPPACPVPFI